MQILFKRCSFAALYIFFTTACHSQNNRLANIDQPYIAQIPADEYGMPAKINASDTSPAWNQPGQKLLLTGTVFRPDGTTPAADVIMYYYHTNTGGKYLSDPQQKRNLPPNSQGQTHGYIRGWVKTGKDGKYYIYTVRPGTYPSRSEPAHVHATIHEPGMDKSYYIDDFVFDDDVLLNSSRRDKMENRGGSGVLRLVEKNEMAVGERSIILGLNVPGYPAQKITGMQSGKQIGEDIHSFTPTHAWGPDKGSRTCPICKYGWYHGILYFIGNSSSISEVTQWLRFFESESVRRDNKLKVYLVDGRNKNYDPETRSKQWGTIGKKLGLQRVALTYLPSFNDRESDIHFNKVNPAAANTILVYKRSRVIDKLVNASPTQEHFNRIIRSLDASMNEYFLAPMPGAARSK